MAEKIRLDILLTEKNIFESRAKAQAMIMEGKILVDDVKILKAGTLVNRNAEIKILGENLPFVSRGGLKLQKALRVFNINLQDKITADIGASTGGFTDCMLQNHAKKVYAIDVGYGQLAWKLRNDERVINLERTNIRNVTQENFSDLIEFASIDVAFISLDKVLPVVYNLNIAEVVALIKPQFEAGREFVGKKGVVKDKKIHASVIEYVLNFAENLGYKICGIDFSPVKGPEGNIEYLTHIKKICTQEINWREKVLATVNLAHEELNK